MFESFLQEPIVYRMVGVPTNLLLDKIDFRVINVNTGDNRIVSKVGDYISNDIGVYSAIKRSNGGLNLNAIRDVLRLLALALTVVRRGDINHCRAHGGAAIGLVLKTLKRTPYIFDYRGSVIEEREELSGKFNMLLRGILKFGENVLLKRADKVICVSQRMATYLYEVHGIESVVIKNPTIPRERSKKSNNSQRFNLIFLGSATPWHEIDNFRILVEHLLALDIKLNVKVLTKNLESFDWLKELEGELEYEIKSVLPVDVHDEIKGANLGYCLIRPSLSKSICMPVKFAEFISSGVPVIVNRGIGDLENIVNEYNLGLVLDRPADVSAISKKEISELEKLKIERLPEELDWNFMKFKWLEIYEEISSFRY